MRGGRHHLLSGLVAVWLTASGVGTRAWAAPATGDVDDPKMSRLFEAAPPRAVPPLPKMAAPAPTSPPPSRPAPPPAVTKRIEVAPLAAPKAGPVAPAVVVAAPAPAVVVAAPALEPVVAAPSPPVAPSLAGDGGKPNASAVDVAARDERSARAEPPPAGREWPYAPRLKLAYRRFPFVRAGAPAGATATPTSISESFESVSIDLYPMSWFLRVGLSTQFGWESAKFDRSGDYFIAESASVGFQWPGRVTPFVEGLAGAGYMRRAGADWNLPTAYWQVGIDAGIEVYLAKRAYVSLAVGYLHPGNLFLREQSLMSVKSDSWSLKFGVGI